MIEDDMTNAQNEQTHQDAAAIIRFWFDEHTHEDWFGSKPEFDQRLFAAFGDLHPAVAAGETHNWRNTTDGRLAEILVLDQFSRQFFRNDARSFATDGMALVLAQEMVRLGYDTALPPQKRMFVYMPYMHSESLNVHEQQAIPLFEALGNEDNLKFEIAHRDVLARFGRYPKRNAALGRTSTPEEVAYINERGDSFF